MIKKAVVLCGGMATRFMPYCKSVPKEMLPILDKPILQYLIEELVDAGISDILIVLGRNKEAILNHFDKVPELEERLLRTNKLDILEIVNKPQNLANITFIKQIEPKGTGYATLKAKNWVGNDNFLLIYGDELMYNKDGLSTTKQLLKGFSKTNQTTLAVQECDYKEVYKYGIITPGKIENDIIEVLNIVEKPKVEDAPSNISTIGPVILTPEIFDILENYEYSGLELNLTESLIKLVDKKKLSAVKIKGTRFDCGNVEGFLKANLFYGMQDEKIKNELIEFFNKIK